MKILSFCPDFKIAPKSIPVPPLLAKISGNRKSRCSFMLQAIVKRYVITGSQLDRYARPTSPRVSIGMSGACLPVMEEQIPFRYRSLF